MPALREYLRLERELLLRYHRNGDNGLRVARATAIVMDVLLEKLFDFAIDKYRRLHGPPPCGICLVALGGYGRGELSPFSDIDIMFLHAGGFSERKTAPLLETLVSEVLYPLWDLKLKVGHSSRSIRETIKEAKSEDQTRNALLEARLICGDSAVFKKFQKLFYKYARSENPREYVEHRLQDQSERRKKFGDTVFLQEPNIKNGVGGLRDYQNILWMVKYRLGEDGLEALEQRGLLSGKERKELANAYDFLLRTRNELHFQSPRATDVLDLEKQPSVAWELGYHQEDIFIRVETFMRDYYRHARCIYLLSRILEQKLALLQKNAPRLPALVSKLASRKSSEKTTFDGFVLHNGYLSAADDTIFQQDPLRLLRLFRYCQQHDGAQLDFELMALVSREAHLLTPQLAETEGARKAFRAILQSKGQVFDALNQMHELGVLCRIISEFEKLHCLVQHEHYHRYTADVHTLATIQELDAVFRGEGEHAETYREAIRKTEIPALLYLILLLHDIGKGISIRDHCTIGTEMATRILPRLGVPPELHPTILFIIKNHLEMARYWQRFDVDDPHTTESFAELVGDEETLRYLYVFTFCDARGTSQDLWNSYKEVLHRQLYRNTLEYLRENREGMERKHQEHRERIHQEILAKNLQDLPRDQINAHFELLPDRYFLQYHATEVEAHLRMIQDLFKQIAEDDMLGPLIPVVRWSKDPDQGFTVVTLVTWDRPGLFRKLAGAFTMAGVNILSTKAISRDDHITIDTFYVADPTGGIVQDPKAPQVFQHYLKETLVHDKDLMADIALQAKKITRSLKFKQGPRPRLNVRLPSRVDVYHELALKRTIVEIQASDQIGLLYRIAKAISDHGFNITFARIATENGAALDTFYIEPIHKEDTTASATSALLALRDSLNEIISADDPVRVR